MSLVQLVGEDRAEEMFNDLPFSLRQDRLAEIMCEPAGPLKTGTGVRGHSPSGPVNETGRKDNR